MSDRPWITIVGLGEDGPDGLPPASQTAINDAEVVMGAKRHLSLLPDLPMDTIEWPVPFANGIAMLKDLRGRRVVVLASGDPFWFGAGSVIAKAFARSEWRALPAPSCFALAAAQMGWPIEKTNCFGLHATGFSAVRPYLSPNLRLLVTLRDGDAVAGFAAYLADAGFADSKLTVMEALGGPRQSIHHVTVQTAADGEFAHPVCVAIKPAGDGLVMTCASGVADELFETDGVMTKRPIRAMTLSALAPKPGELLWDIGGGSGSIGIEWLLAHPSCKAIAIEQRPDRVGLMQTNADRLGVPRLQIVTGSAPDCLEDLPSPDAVFVGGGLNAGMLAALQSLLPTGTRLVANAVTLEAEALLVDLHQKRGGELTRVEVSSAAPLGGKTGWKASYPIVQWSGEL